MSEAATTSAVEQGVNRFFGTFEQAQRAIAIENVYGQPIASGETVVVPIASVSQVFGMGGGIGSDGEASARDEGVGGGGGGLVRARPIAVAEIDADGVKVHAVVDENRALAVSLAFAAWAVFWTARTLIKIFKPAAN
ncbi:MAG: hypothetical protein HY870_18675 [Chloroflexi bacterium]|nr:hypothetical protein [Chloroflexota bacterium]